jgi:mRNA-degrading endonuclease toxin of MazEF toxin-antitoxin module
MPAVPWAGDPAHAAVEGRERPVIVIHDRRGDECPAVCATHTAAPFQKLRRTAASVTRGVEVRAGDAGWT